MYTIPHPVIACANGEVAPFMGHNSYVPPLLSLHTSELIENYEFQVPKVESHPRRGVRRPCRRPGEDLVRIQRVGRFRHGAAVVAEGVHHSVRLAGCHSCAFIRKPDGWEIGGQRTPNVLSRKVSR